MSSQPNTDQRTGNPGRVIRVLQFADIINRFDFIDVIVRNADPTRFLVGVCVRDESSNIAAPTYSPATPRWVLRGISRSAIPLTAVRLAGILRSWQADILHTHHYDQAFIGWLATRIHPATRLIVGRHYSDNILGMPVGLKRTALLCIEKMVNRGATRIIAPSRAIVHLLQAIQKVDPGKIDLIPYGFEPDKYKVPALEDIEKVREEFHLEGCFVVGTFSRLHLEKGHRFLIRAIAMLKEKLPNLRVLLLGDGPHRAEIERQIMDENVGDRVRLAGMRRDAMTIMAAVDAVVQPSLSEAFSQVMIEAMWMGKPLVMADVSGARDVAGDGKTGIVVPAGDAGALACEIERLAADPGLRSRMGVAGREFAESHLRIDRIIPKYESAYLRALARQ